MGINKILSYVWDNNLRNTQISAWGNTFEHPLIHIMYCSDIQLAINPELSKSLNNTLPLQLSGGRTKEDASVDHQADEEKA